MSPETLGSSERSFRGIQQVEITTSGWLFNPEEAFALTNILNSDRSPDRWVGIEVYPTVSPKALELAKKLGSPKLSNGIPPKVTPDLVRQWQRDYPRTRVSRVHLEFSFDSYETYFHRPIIGENIRPLREGIKQRFFQLAWVAFFGPATSKRGAKLAQDLEVGVNAHTNVIEGFAKRGELDDLKRKLKFVLAENERPYRSPHLKRLNSKGVTSQQLASDPEVIRKEIIDRYGLDGLLLGVDHLVQIGKNPAKVLKKTADITRAIHLASSRQDQEHGTLEIGDPKILEFLEEVSKTTFNGQVSAALDLNPIIFRAIPFRQQIEIVRNTLSWIENTQQK